MQISDVVVAEWVRMLTTGADMDLAALTTAFNNILETPCVALKDGVGTQLDPVKIVVPLPPVPTLAELNIYLSSNTDLLPGLGAALLFGCGR